MLVDLHSHIDTEDFERDREEVLKRCEILVVNAGVDLESDMRTLELSDRFPNVIPAVGLHPENINYEDPMTDLEKIIPLVDRAQLISEVGLDYYWIKDQDKRKFQRKVLETFLSLGERKKKPLVIHIRGGMKDFLDVISSFKVTFDVHAYEGSVRDAEKLIDKGGYISVPPVIIRDSQRQNVVRSIDRERVITETDSPFLGPTRERNEPCNVRLTLDKLADLWKIDVKEVEEQILLNFNKFISSGKS